MAEKIGGGHSKSVQRVLEKKLARLKRLVPFEELLTVRWNPRSHGKISGEVVGNTILIYDENLQEALKTIKHEYLDCLLTRKLVDPLIAIINTLMKLKEREIYKGKERIVNTLSKLVADPTKECTWDDH